MNAEPKGIQGVQTCRGAMFPATGMEPLAELHGKIGQLSTALSQLVDMSDDNVAQKASRLNETLTGFEPAVTMIGQVKSGKTTLVNAMAGRPDLLPADVNPWTSVVTSLHLAPHGAELGKGARFRFFDAKEWTRLLSKGGRIGELANRAGAHEELDRIRAQIEAMQSKTRARLGRKFELLLGQTHDYDSFDSDLIERYICLGDATGEEEAATQMTQGRFADITRSAELYLRHDGLPMPLCLRDTPGVNDTFMMREQITVGAIRDSRICVVVLSAHQALSSVDMALIRLISNVRAREVVIFVNRIDELSDPAAQVPEIERSIRRTLKDQSGPTDAKIIFGSALWAVRALQDDLRSLPRDSAGALLNWARSGRCAGRRQSAAGTVWDLSGVPKLFAVLSARIAEGPGQEVIDKVSRSALNLASGLWVGTRGNDTGNRIAAQMCGADLEAEFHAIASRHFRALDIALEDLVESYRQRVDRAQESFIDRASGSLVAHLETKGHDAIWEYSPTGLRMLLRSAYNVFGTASQHAASRVMQAAAQDLDGLFARAFGGGPGDFHIRSPNPHRIAPPVFLGQTIVLDVSGRWWAGWWRRWRGYKSVAGRFNNLIRAETEAIMTELKDAQAEEICRAAVGTLDEFLDEQRVILTGIMSRCEAGDGTATVCSSGEDAARQQKLESTLETLVRSAA